MFLIDNNLPPKLSRMLVAHFPQIAHVADFGLEDDSDHRIWQFAKKNKLHILTKDTDFIKILNLRGYPPKIIRLNCGNLTTKEIEVI